MKKLLYFLISLIFSIYLIYKGQELISIYSPYLVDDGKSISGNGFHPKAAIGLLFIIFSIIIISYAINIILISLNSSKLLILTILSASTFLFFFIIFLNKFNAEHETLKAFFASKGTFIFPQYLLPYITNNNYFVISIISLIISITSFIRYEFICKK